MKIKVSEATDNVLNFLVHKAIGAEPLKAGCTAPPYSTDWCFGGPIKDREGITCGPWTTSSAIAYKGADHALRPFCYVGRTQLIAAMRCYVASKLGLEVDVPGELV